MKTKRTPGFWVLTVVGLFILLILFLGQMMAFINYNFTVSIGLQEPVEMISEIGVALNKGFGVGDTIVYIPLLIAGLIGLWREKEWGLYTMTAALAITAYWPVVSMCLLLFAKGAPGFYFTNYLSYSVILIPIFIYGIWGMIYIYKNRDELVNKKDNFFKAFS